MADDLAIIQARRIIYHCRWLHLALFCGVPAAIYGGSPDSGLFIRIILPTIIGAAFILGFLSLTMARKKRLHPKNSRRLVREAGIGCCIVALLCSIWCVFSWLSAPAEMKSHYPLIMAMGSLGTTFCMSNMRAAAISNAAIGLVPISFLLFFSGQPVDIAAGISMLVASAFLLRMILEQHHQLVDLLLLQKQLHDLAVTDPLTGLLNRRGLDESLEVAMAPHRDRVRPFSIALLDLDGFKPINDCHGHGIGDMVLQAVGQRLRAAAGDKARVVRMGGDEFAVLIPHESDIAPDAVGTHMLAALAAPFRIADLNLAIGASIGVAQWPRDGDNPEQLFDTADNALYSAKAAAKASAQAVAMPRDDEGQSAMGLR
ncbi:MAG: GGDEF domain-containing protein [Pseudomonadota bacterium]